MSGELEVPSLLGRYALSHKLASGGMATVFLGRLVGPLGFSRVVAIKRMLPAFAKDPHFVAMFLDEARLASRIHHPNVVATLDVLVEGTDVFIVMEYVEGQALSALLGQTVRTKAPVPLPIAASVMSGVLSGLHAAHEARDRRGEPLGIIHRDVSPQNILVGVDGVARIMDFGIAKAKSQLHVSYDGRLVGKLPYMSPEQFGGSSKGLDRRVDVYAAGAVLWGMLAGRPLFRGDDAVTLMGAIVAGDFPSLRELRPDVGEGLERIVLRALAREPADRFATAKDFDLALQAEVPRLASTHAVGEWVAGLAADVLKRRGKMVEEMELSAATGAVDLPALGLAGPASSAPASTPPAPRSTRPLDPPAPTTKRMRKKDAPLPPDASPSRSVPADGSVEDAATRLLPHVASAPPPETAARPSPLSFAEVTTTGPAESARGSYWIVGAIAGAAFLGTVVTSALLLRGSPAEPEPAAPPAPLALPAPPPVEAPAPSASAPSPPPASPPASLPEPPASAAARAPAPLRSRPATPRPAASPRPAKSAAPGPKGEPIFIPAMP